MSNKTIYQHYDQGQCPDCQAPIPADAVSGSACENCGHTLVDDPEDEG